MVSLSNHALFAFFYGGVAMRERKAAAAAFVLTAILTAQAQPSKTYKARLAPVPLDISMMANITGSGSVTAVLAGNKLTINGAFEGLRSNATKAQVHKGPVTGVRGPVVFDLMVSGTTSGTISGMVELTSVQLTDLEKRRLYVQLHSEKAPDGNLWGWLFPQESRK